MESSNTDYTYMPYATMYDFVMIIEWNACSALMFAIQLKELLELSKALYLVALANHSK